MRKLPPDHEVLALRQSGMKAKDIAAEYGVSTDSVYKTIRRAKGLHVLADDYKSVDPYATIAVGNGRRAEHRDTGDGIGFGKPQDAYRPQRLRVDEVGDLLREWGVSQ